MCCGDVVHDKTVSAGNTHEDEHALRDTVIRHEGHALGRRQYAIVCHCHPVMGVADCDIYRFLVQKELQGMARRGCRTVPIMQRDALGSDAN